MYANLSGSVFHIFFFGTNSSLADNDGGETHLLGWNLGAEDLIHIPEHWLKYQEPSSLQHYYLAFIYTIFMIIALIGNGLVIWIFCM